MRERASAKASGLDRLLQNEEDKVLQLSMQQFLEAQVETESELDLDSRILEELGQDGLDDSDGKDGIDPKLYEIAIKNCQESYDNHIDTDGNVSEMTLNKFCDAVEQLNMKWSKQQSTIYFDELDSLDKHALGFEQFKTGLLNHVVNSFFYMAKSTGCDVYSSPDENSKIGALPPLEHLTLTNWVNGFGEVWSEGKKDEGQVKWVRKKQILPKYLSNSPTSSITSSKVKKKKKSGKVDVNMDDIPRTLCGNDEIPFLIEQLGLSMRLRHGFERLLSKNLTAEQQRFMAHQNVAEGLLIKLEQNPDSGLPNLKRLIMEGKALCRTIDKPLYCISFSLDKSQLGAGGLVQFDSILKILYDLVKRIVRELCNMPTIYHPDVNTFVMLYHGERRVSDFVAHFVKLLEENMRGSTLHMRATVPLIGLSIARTEHEATDNGLGSFVDRSVGELRGQKNDHYDPVKAEQEKLSRLLFNLVSDQANFCDYCQECFETGESKYIDWTEHNVIDCIDHVLERGGSFTFVDENKHDVLMIASKCGYEHILRKLLENENCITFDRQNFRGQTFPMLAVESEKFPTNFLSELFSKLRNYNTIDILGRDLLMYSMNADETELVTQLACNGMVDIRRALYIATKQDDVRTIEDFALRGLKLFVRIEQKEGLSIGCVAARDSANRVLEYVLKETGNLGSDYQRKTPLHYACENGNITGLKMMLSSREDTNQLTVNGESGLHFAAENGHTEACKLLIQNDAHIDPAERINGHTPLLRAVAKGQLDTVKFLVENNADITIKDNCGFDAPANGNGSQEIAHFFQTVGSDSDVNVYSDLNVYCSDI